MIATIKLSELVSYLCIAIVKICTHFNIVRAIIPNGTKINRPLEPQF